MTKNKDKGTAAERLVAEYLKSTYWPYAERRALAGGLDKGDITGTPGLAWEVKAAKTLCVPAWLRETEAERENAKADYATLIIKPQGVGKTRMGQWYALMDRNKFNDLLEERPFGEWASTHTFEATIRKMPLAVSMRFIADAPVSYCWAVYPTFVATQLNGMVQLLVGAGYGTYQEVPE